MTIRHAKTSGIPNPADPTLVGGADWDAAHTGGLPFQSGEGSPVNAVLPNQVGELYLDTANGGLYMAVNVDVNGWISVSGDTDQLAGNQITGINVSNSGDLILTGGNDERVMLTDVLALEGTGNRLVWRPEGFTDGTQHLDLYLGNGELVFSGTAVGTKFAKPPILANVTAPADADLAASQVALWFDDTPGATKLRIKAKDSNGAVRTGSVNLT